MSDEQIQETVAEYCRIWSEPDEAERRRLLEKVWAKDGTYTDPFQQVVGREEFLGASAGFQQQNPGARFDVVSNVEQHHGMIRFLWRWVAGDGSTVMEGIDFGELGDDGRLQRLVGFSSPLPSPG